MERSVDREFSSSGIAFTADGPLEAAWNRARNELFDCVRQFPDGTNVLQEGGVYAGCWLESTGSINTELLGRFLPETAASTFLQFAKHQRDDGLLPYKVTPEGPSFRQIQMVTPFARSVWNVSRLVRSGSVGPWPAGESNLGTATSAWSNAAVFGDEFVLTMYGAMSRNDEWLARHRDTRGTGCVEAFSTFDTGHDRSARFWHVPDTPYVDDPSRYDPHSPILPFIAPDLTANVYCQRRYLARFAHELAVQPDGSSDAGRVEEARSWTRRAETSLRGLHTHCFHEGDGFFYDCDRNGAFVRIQSDVLLRVLACEVGDDGFFESSLRRYLLNTRKFFARYPFTSIAMDDPRFDPDSSYNSWSGATNFLSIIRAVHAFEYHHRYVELTWLMQPILSALSRMERYGQCISPWTGTVGYTEKYAPTILCVLDFVERLCGVLPTADGEVWLTGLLPAAFDHGRRVAASTSYARIVRGRKIELQNTPEECLALIDEKPRFRFPYGVRLVLDLNSEPRGAIGLVAGSVDGVITLDGRDHTVSLTGNEYAEYAAGVFHRVRNPGIIHPTYE